MSENTDNKSAGFPKTTPTGLITGKQFNDLKDNPEATKELDPSRFLSSDKESHICYIKGGLLVTDEGMKIKLGDSNAKREDDVPLYVVRRLMFGEFVDTDDHTAGDNWMQLCKNAGKIYRVFRLDKWIYDESDTGMLKLRLTAYEPTSVHTAATAAGMAYSLEHVRNLLSRNFKSFKKTRPTEYDSMESDRIDLIGYIRTLPYKDVVKPNHLDKDGLPLERVKKMATGFFRCTADPDSAIAIPKS